MSTESRLAKILEETAELINFKYGDFFRVRAYREAANTILHLDGDIKEIVAEGNLVKLPGIGKKLAGVIIDFIETGDFEEHTRLLKEIPAGLLDIMALPGMGPKKAKMAYEKLGISSIEDLEKGIKEHRLKELDGFGEKTENNIIEAIKDRKRYAERILLPYAEETAREVLVKLKKIPGVKKAEPAGSLRRRSETIGDIDILFVSDKDPVDVTSEFIKDLPEEDIIAHGDKKTSFIWEDTCQVDLRHIEEDAWGAALQYFTGSKSHNIVLRKHAIKLGLKLNEYGVFKGKKNISSKTEKEVYETLGMSYIEPELRENMGEIDAAVEGRLPKLLKMSEIKGDTHMHSVYSDGENTIEEMALSAQKMGYEWIAVTDHSKSLHIANGLDESRLEKKIKEIKKLNKKFSKKTDRTGIKILCGAEVDIKKDGSLDYDDDILKELDIVIAAIHSGFKEPEEMITQRIIAALNNPYVDILAHPTGRLLNEREPYAVDIHRIIEEAVLTHTVIEINAHPSRLDLSYNLAKEAVSKGVKLSIGSDSHSGDGLWLIEYGVSVARRGWLEKSDLINTMSLKQLETFIKARRKSGAKK
ncbi:MAG: DNA polymerase/3'-5' exonuclease PolX [Elusimicrobiota bacterium]